MNKFFKLLTIRSKLLIFAIFLATIILVTGGFSYYYFNKILQISELRNYTGVLKMNIFQIKKAENDIFNYQKDSSLFDNYDIEKFSYINKNIKEINDIFSSLKNSFWFGIFKQNKKINRAIRDFDFFSQKHTLFIKNIKEKGSLHNGLIDQLQSAASQLEQSTQDYSQNQKFWIPVQTLREVEIDFLLRKNISLLDKFNQEYSELIQSTNITDTSLTTIGFERRKFIDDLSEYRTNFNALISKEMEIGITYHDGLISDIMEQLNIIEQNISNISEIIIVETEKEIDRAILRLIIFILLLAVFVISAIFYLASTVTNQINIIKNYIHQLAIGSLPEKLATKSQDEISQMADELNILVDNLRIKALFLQEIGNGNFKSNYALIGEKDILGLSLKDMQSNLIKSIEEEDKRKNIEDIQDWINMGLAKFSDILRENIDNLDKLSYELILNLVKYLGAIQGSFYINNDADSEDTYLQLVAAYAWDRRKFIEKKIKFGEGLIGTAAVEQITYYFENVPDNYINITSGFGKANPKVLLIVPLVLNKQVFGAVEIASFEDMDKDKIEFVEKTADDIATTLSYVKTNTRTFEKLHLMQNQLEEVKNTEHILLQEIDAQKVEIEYHIQQGRNKQEIIDKIHEESSLQIARLRKLNDSAIARQEEIEHKVILLEKEKNKLLSEIIIKNKEINQFRKKYTEIVKLLEQKQDEIEEFKSKDSQ